MPRSASTPGIADIAAASDVSIATVSRVLTGKANVTDDVRNRVLATVKRLNYRPLRRPKRSVMVGVPPEGQKTAVAYLSHEEERRGRVQWNQAFIAASRRLQESGRSLNLHFIPPVETNAGGGEGPVLQPGALHEQFGGLIGVDRGDARWHQALTQSGLPAVRFGYYPIDIRVPQVIGDAFDGSLRVMEHLISRGHKRIAIWRARLDVPSGERRSQNERDKYAAYRFALAEAGIEFQKSWELETGYVWQDVATVGQQLMAIKPAPTALFIDNDWTTSMIMRWPGGDLPISKDILSSFEIGHYVDSGRDPGDFLFACAEQPMDRMGEVSADILLHQLAGRHYAPDFVVKVPPHFFTAQQVIEHAKTNV